MRDWFMGLVIIGLLLTAIAVTVKCSAQDPIEGLEADTIGDTCRGTTFVYNKQLYMMGDRKQAMQIRGPNEGILVTFSSRATPISVMAWGQDCD